MEYGSVLELDDIIEYRIPEEIRPFYLPFMENKRGNYNTVFYQSGRNAIEELFRYLKNNSNIEAVIMPDYICQTVKDAAVRAEIEIKEYRINREYETKVDDIEKNLSINTCVYICHYFGKPLSEKLIKKIRKWRDKRIIVIEDITMSLLSSDTDGIGFGDYVIGSLRKWFPIPDGGFVSSDCCNLPDGAKSTSVSKYTDYYMVVQTLKREYISGGCLDKDLKDVYMGYYSLSIKELFSDYNIYPMSTWSFNYLNNVNIYEIIEKRKKNYDVLYKLLSKCDFIHPISEPRGNYIPFGMGLQVSDRDELIRYLIDNGIYCNIHWRLEEKDNNPDIKYLVEHSITVPCDQRYSTEDMTYIAAKIIEWYEKKQYAK